jgi:hypothetical protein
MSQPIDAEVWLRGTAEAQPAQLTGLPADPESWSEADVRTLLTEMLLALDRARNPDGERPAVTLRGFSWIVSPAAGGVLVHLDLPLGTASAGPFAIDEARLTRLIARALMPVGDAAGTVH